MALEEMLEGGQNIIKVSEWRKTACRHGEGDSLRTWRRAKATGEGSHSTQEGEADSLQHGAIGM